MPRFAKFRFKVPERIRGKKLYEVLNEIEKMQECSERGSLNPIITSYGCAGFHFCYYNNDKILQYCGGYVSSEEKKRLEGFLAKEGEYCSLGEEIDGGILIKIVKDHPDVVDGGLIQLVFSMTDFEVEYDKIGLEEAIKALRWNLQRLEKLKEVLKDYDYEIDYGYMELGDTDADLEEEESGLTMYLNDFVFETDKTIEGLEEEIDKLIKPLMAYLKRKPRTDLYLVR